MLIWLDPQRVCHSVAYFPTVPRPPIRVAILGGTVRVIAPPRLLRLLTEGTDSGSDAQVSNRVVVRN